MITVKILTLACLLMIFFQDVKSRSVYWILFPVLAALLLLLYYFKGGSQSGLWRTILFNIAFFIGQMALVTIYFSVRNRKWTNITAGLLGWGDLLFILSIAFYLSIFNFLFFYITSLVIVLLFWQVWQSCLPTKSKHIPLAGLQALLFVSFLLSDWWLKLCNVTDDAWILNLMGR